MHGILAHFDPQSNSIPPLCTKCGQADPFKTRLGAQELRAVRLFTLFRRGDECQKLFNASDPRHEMDKSFSIATYPDLIRQVANPDRI